MKLNQSYIGVRRDILEHIPFSAKRLLDVGCSVGALGEVVARRNSGAQIYGIELDPEMAEIAREKLDKVYIENMDHFSLVQEFADEAFDCVVLADILEHLRDPWNVVHEAIEILEPGGVIVACIPNVRHIDTLFNLLVRGNWPYRDRGVHDRTHLRFFTRMNILELFSSPKLEVEKVVANYRILERPSSINRWAKYFAWPGIRGFLAFQYIVVAKKIKQ
jgi:2-polyprenyl-3-methyl-5-hydroxy-6-metoxy-1,4-benzoquinol methylase